MLPRGMQCPGMSQGTKGSAVRAGRWLVRHVLPLVVLAGLVASGLFLYRGERDARQRAYALGDSSAPGRVDIAVTVERMDPATQRLTLRVLPVPEGDLAEGPDSPIPARALTISTSSAATSMLRYPAGQPVTATELTVDAAGIISDYPFDRYRATVGFAVQAGDAAVPVTLTLDDTDPFFGASVGEPDDTAGRAVLGVTMSRSRSTLILAWLMMAIMWALALSVAAATRVLAGQRKGLVWPALGWMAATLFALAGFRNAAPGNPPIGSLFDYAAYLWAEVIVAICLVVTAITGVRSEAGNSSREASGAGCAPGRTPLPEVADMPL